MKRIVGLLSLLLLGFACLASEAQTSFTQSYGPVSSIAGCTAAAGVPVSSANSPCGGQGVMGQASQVTVHTLSWVAAPGTGAVSACTVELESSAAGSVFALLGTQQSCTTSGSYSFVGSSAAANFVKFNVTALTTTQNAAVTFSYAGATPGGSPFSTPYLTFCTAATGGTSTCSNLNPGAQARVVGGVSTLAGNTQVVTFAPGFSATTSYTCVANDVTTRANVVQAVPTSATTMTITNTTGAADAINWICIGS